MLRAPLLSTDMKKKEWANEKLNYIYVSLQQGSLV